MDEVAEWVVHAAQLPKEVADTFRSNMVTGYDFPELAAKQVTGAAAAMRTRANPIWHVCVIRVLRSVTFTVFVGRT